MNCKLCNKETEGSVGATGIKWNSICQPCKNIEDKVLAHKIESQAMLLKEIFTKER